MMWSHDELTATKTESAAPWRPAIGTNTSGAMPGATPKNPAGRHADDRQGRAPTRIVRPTADGSDPKRRCHAA